MPQEVKIPNGVPVFQLEEVIIGSQFKFAVRFRRLISSDPDVFQDFDFTGMTLKADVKDKPAREVTADAEITCTARVPNDGWVDFFMDGEMTGTLVEHDYEASFKVWPTGNEELGDTLCVLILPMKYLATR